MAIITRKYGQLEYEAAERISCPHGFTTRLGGVSRSIFSSLNIACRPGEAPEHVAENLRLLGQALNFDPNQLVLTRQTHSDIIRTVTAADHRGLFHTEYPECDGLITNTPGVTLMVFTADCTPILLMDPVTGAVGAVHAGWRGTAADIGGKAVRAMVEAFGCRPENIRAAIGPHIGPCCFETDGDVPQALSLCYGREAVAQQTQFRNGKYYVNLKALNALSLTNAGVIAPEVSQSCTFCQHQRYWSHRFTGGQRGSQGAVITCQEGRP